MTPATDSSSALPNAATSGDTGPAKSGSTSPFTMPTYGEIPLFKNEYALLRTVARSPEEAATALRPLLFPPTVNGAKLDELSAEEQDEVVTVIANLLVAEQAALTTAEKEGLTPRRDPNHQRLLEDAEVAFGSGLRSSGRAQREDYRDALVILRGIVDSPSGRRDYGVWFQVGWLLWQTEATPKEVEEAFYQAVRLSRATPNAYFTLASRHLAMMQQLLAHPEEAAATLSEAMELFPTDPLILWEAARAASLRGRTEETQSLVERCLVALPPLTLLLFRDPVLEAQRAAVAAALQRRREAARARAQTATERWRQALDLVRRAEAAGSVSLPIPAHLTEGGAPPNVEEDEEANMGRAAEVIHAAQDAFEKAIEEARLVETRTRRHIEKLFQDKETWERSLVALKSEAEAMGVGLDHPPTAKGILRKKNPQHERVFVNFHSCRQNLQKIDKEMREHLPTLKTNLTKAGQYRALLENTSRRFDEDSIALL